MYCDCDQVRQRHWARASLRRIPRIAFCGRASATEAHRHRMSRRSLPSVRDLYWRAFPSHPVIAKAAVGGDKMMVDFRPPISQAVPLPPPPSAPCARPFSSSCRTAHCVGVSDGREKSWVLSSLLVGNFLFRTTARATAALASRSKVSATCKTARLAPGSVNCPATSRACSARSSHSRASFEIATIGSSRLYWKMGDLSPGPRSQPISLYRNHTAASDETACQIAAQSPSEKNKASSSPAPDVSFVTEVVGSDRDRPV
jgi:hypothetical protein